jgi:hypothetical protein
MKTTYAVAGHLTGEERRIELNGRLFVDEREWRARKARMDEAIGCLSDDEAQRILQVIDEEFGQIDPDDWR